MAKCIQVVGQGVAIRMSDDDAFQVVVRDHDGEYCSKRVWREERASEYRTERADPCTHKLVGRKITPTASLQFNAQHGRRNRSDMGKPR